MDPLVGIVMGSDSDWPTMEPAAGALAEFGVPYEVGVLSAHRTPQRMLDYATAAAGRGLRVLVAGAGGAAHLPGMLAAATPLPVIGVPRPLDRLDGLDSLLSIVQMPAGVPVATGTPAGIWTIDSSESRPSSVFSGTGTPITGRGVAEATMPGRWAAPPAPATITRRPRPAASRA